MDGLYTLCFGNRISTLTTKVVMFEMDVGDSPKLDAAADATAGNVTRSYACRSNRSRMISVLI